MSLLHKTNFMHDGCVYGVKPKTAPSMYYVLNTHSRHCDRGIIILMLLMTETALQHTMKAKRRSDMINKISNHPKNSPVFILCNQVRYFIDMAISRFDLGNSCQRSEAMSMTKVIYEINQPLYSHCFCCVQIRPCIQT